MKPENIILSRDRSGRLAPKLIDFGISKITSGDKGTLLSTGRALGTPLYMSPEQLRAEDDLDARTDVWAVGVVLFEIFAGRRPFDAASRDVVAAQILTGRAPSLRDYAPELSDAMTRVIMRALEPDRKARFPTMRAMHEAFAAAMAATPHWPR